MKQHHYPFCLVNHMYWQITANFKLVKKILHPKILHKRNKMSELGGSHVLASVSIRVCLCVCIFVCLCLWLWIVVRSFSFKRKRFEKLIFLGFWGLKNLKNVPVIFNFTSRLDHNQFQYHHSMHTGEPKKLSHLHEKMSQFPNQTTQLIIFKLILW